VASVVQPAREKGAQRSGADYGNPHPRKPLRTARASALAGHASAYIESLYHMAL
jgi:hypothetical protein